MAVAIGAKRQRLCFPSLEPSDPRVRKFTLRPEFHLGSVSLYVVVLKLRRNKHVEHATQSPDNRSITVRVVNRDSWVSGSHLDSWKNPQQELEDLLHEVYAAGMAAEDSAA